MGTPRIHVFAGERERIDAPSIRKFSARGADGQVWKGRVLKLGMQRATVADLCVAKGRVAAQLGEEVRVCALQSCVLSVYLLCIVLVNEFSTRLLQWML